MTIGDSDDDQDENEDRIVGGAHADEDGVVLIMSGSFQGGCAEKLVLAPKTIKGAGNSWDVPTFVVFWGSMSRLHSHCTLASKYHSRPRYLGQFGRRSCPDVRASAVLRAWHRRKALLKQTDWRRSWHLTHMQCTPGLVP